MVKSNFSFVFYKIAVCDRNKLYQSDTLFCIKTVCKYVYVIINITKNIHFLNFIHVAESKIFSVNQRDLDNLSQLDARA